MNYKVYVLIRNGKAVYVGCSKNVPQRLSYHKKLKDFDNHIILKSYKTRKDALSVENGLIKFITLFGDGNWYNAEEILLSYERDLHIRNNG